ncbi:MAG: hypothetical protein JRN26_08270 [Nitrososphaerota archaeon]|jgi:hypothetical protein|nr:hypothetical protein [Nitrososphaerota archaeon]
MLEIIDTDIQRLNYLIDFTDKWLESNNDIAEKLKIKKKMLGFLGEAHVVMELHEKFKDKLVNIKWYGGGKSGCPSTFG